ncbi:MAG: hypothetical protein JNM94_09855 [Phycisphaerae bacterium]|nr:hypothetical protein [Phycisphaerae bacterium]
MDRVPIAKVIGSERARDIAAVFCRNGFDAVADLPEALHTGAAGTLDWMEFTISVDATEEPRARAFWEEIRDATILRPIGTQRGERDDLVTVWMHCGTCRYPLVTVRDAFAAGGGRCPECGRRFVAPREEVVDPPTWTCERCGETLPGTFETCWRCDAEPEEAPPAHALTAPAELPHWRLVRPVSWLGVAFVIVAATVAIAAYVRRETTYQVRDRERADLVLTTAVVTGGVVVAWIVAAPKPKPKPKQNPTPKSKPKG